MNANIFEFKNNEILMQFNPLFLPTNNIVDNSGNLKTFKLSNSSYLFSDIIKVFVGGDLTQNLLETGQSLPQTNISNENIFSFNIGKNNNPNDNSTLSGLKAISDLISNLSVLGGINFSQGEDLNKSTSSSDGKLFTADGLKILLDNLIKSFNPNKISDSDKVNKSSKNDDKSKEKNESDSEIKKLISQILSSLNTGKPVIINLIGNQENLKLEIGKIDIQALQNSSNGLENIIEGISPNKNSELTAADSNSNIDEIDAKAVKLKQNGTDAPENGKDILNGLGNKKELKISLENSQLTINDSDNNLSGEIKESALNLLQEESNTKENGKGNITPENKTALETTLNSGKNVSEKISDYLKSLNQDRNFNKTDLFSIKLEVTGTETNSNIKTNILKGSINQSFGSSTKNLQDSLSLEKLIASKSNMKDFAKISSQQNSSSKTGTNIKIQSDNGFVNKQQIQNQEIFVPENDLQVINKKFNGNDVTIKIEDNNITGQKLSSSIKENVQKISDQVSRQEPISENAESNKFDNTLKAEDQKDQIPVQKESISNQNFSKENIQYNKIEQAHDPKANSQKIIEIQTPVKENDKISNNSTDSKTNSTGGIKTDNLGKITINETPTENSFNENLESDSKNTEGSTKDQSQLSQSKVENLFSSYLNKNDINNIQNIKNPVYFDNISEQMKKIDASEIVNELSKLAYDKDQKNVVLKLMPESLGKVKISMDINKNIVHVHAEVENEAARSLMQNNADNLRQSLVQQGMQLNSLNISLSNQQEQKSNKTFLSKRKPVYSEQVKEIDEKEKNNISKHYGYNTYEFLA